MKRLLSDWSLLDNKYVAVWVDKTGHNIKARFEEGHTPLFRKECACVYYGRVYGPLARHRGYDALVLNPAFKVPNSISIPENPKTDEVLEMRLVGNYETIPIDEIVAITLLENKKPNAKKDGKE